MKKKISLRWKIAIYLFIFAAFTITSLFVFQVVLLEPLYERSKIISVRSVGDEIAKNIDADNLEEVVMLSSMQNDACVIVSYKDEAMSIKNQMCTAFANMSKEELNTLIGYANLSSNNTYLGILDDVNDSSDGRIKHILYARVVEGLEGNGVILIYSGISPISATVRTLKNQLLCISGILIIIILLLSLMIYEGIAKPLTKINEAAKHLPEGRYDFDDKTNQYKEAQELNQTLMDAARDIQKADKAKRDLISNVSHDLRTPLTMITGYGEMMRDLPGEKTDENLQVIIDESKRLNNLVNDLLDLSKLQDNRIVLEEEDFDISKMIETQMRKYDVYRYQDGFTINYESCGSAIVHADLKRMEQVFNNFMINAINYSTDKKTIVVREILNDGVIRVEVQDFGEGIEEEKINDIWDRYYKIDKTHVRVTQGSGIGLSIVKQILDLHQFKYGVISKVNEGSTFYFEIPVIENKA